MSGNRAGWGRKALGLAGGLFMIALGSMWTAQGLGWLPGAASSASPLATLGPLVAGFGVALGYVSLRKSTSSK